MSSNLQSPVIERQKVLNAIANLRRDWEQDNPENLINAQASFGFLLFDIASYLGLTEPEIREALGAEICVSLEAEQLIGFQGRDQVTFSEWMPESWEPVVSNI